MTNNAYLKIILTVIAVELLVLILKSNTPQPLYASTSQSTQALHAGYNMPNTANQTPPETVNVRIVDLAVPNTKALPVVSYNEVWNGRVKPYKVEVVNEVQLKKAEE